MHHRSQPGPALRPLFAWLAFALTALPGFAEAARYSPPRFTATDRRQKIEAVLPELDKLYGDLGKTQHLPGLVYGVVLDGELIHRGALGFANLERKTAVSSRTAFRIASMTKSFVAMAALKLRDDGKLSLDDPVGRYLPEFREVHPLTADAAPITIRHLMTMTTGLPEDNPWGDRQMAISADALRKFVSGGLSFSNAPGQKYEYSNLGFVLLGRIVSQVAGMPFQAYVTNQILRPLAMNNTRWEFAEVPADQLALGYRWEHDTWRLEPMLHDGDGAAMGGLITTLDDFARYVAFHLAAWPPRDDPEQGPVRRATVREMHKPWAFSQMSPKETLLDGKTPDPSVGFYGYGLGWKITSQAVVQISHGGGLPGFGSIYRFCPDYGIGVIAFANLTYAPVYAPASRALSILLEHGNLAPRALIASPILETRQRQLAELLVSWDLKLGRDIVAENFFLDRSREDWIKLSGETLAPAGRIASIGPLAPENQLRGTFRLQGEKGAVKVTFTLTPENVPKVQQLKLTFEPNP